MENSASGAYQHLDSGGHYAGHYIVHVSNGHRRCIMGCGKANIVEQGFRALFYSNPKKLF